MRQAMSRAAGQSSTRNVSTGTSCTLRSPASISRNSVGAGLSVRNCVVLPTPLGPISKIFAPRRSARRSSADIILGNGASLAPMYDVLRGEVWETVSKISAHKIAGRNSGRSPQRGRDWQWFGRERGFNPGQVLEGVSTLAELAIAEAGAAECEVAGMPAGEHPNETGVTAGGDLARRQMLTRQCTSTLFPSPSLIERLGVDRRVPGSAPPSPRPPPYARCPCDDFINWHRPAVHRSDQLDRSC